MRVLRIREGAVESSRAGPPSRRVRRAPRASRPPDRSGLLLKALKTSSARTIVSWKAAKPFIGTTKYWNGLRPPLGRLSRRLSQSLKFETKRTPPKRTAASPRPRARRAQSPSSCRGSRQRSRAQRLHRRIAAEPHLVGLPRKDVGLLLRRAAGRPPSRASCRRAACRSRAEAPSSPECRSPQATAQCRRRTRASRQPVHEQDPAPVRNARGGTRFGRFASSSIFLPSSVSSTKLRLAPIHAFASAHTARKLVWPSGITCLCASSSDGAAQLVTESRIEAARIPERTNMKDS